MQTLTHLAIGALVGTIVAPNDRTLQIASAAGAIAPDILLVPKFCYDKFRGRQPFAHQSKGTVLFIQILNSIPLWLAVGMISSIIMSNWAQWAHPYFFMNALIHLFIDQLTHSGKEFEKTDPGGLWPLPMRLNIGIWEYRYAHGVLKLKPFELAILISSVIVVVILQLLVPTK